MSQKNPEKCVNSAEAHVQQIKYIFNPMEQGVRWTEKYAGDIEKLWKSLPHWLSRVLATVAVLVLASGLHGMVLKRKKKMDFVPFLQSLVHGNHAYEDSIRTFDLEST